MTKYVKIHSKDDVAVAVCAISEGETIADGERVIKVSEPIERGHKIALRDMKEGEQVIKYGYPIGSLTCDVTAGSLIHVHNLRTGLSDNLEYQYHPNKCLNVSTAALDERKFFMGYERRDGRVGIRNELWIIPTVGCVNENARRIAELCKNLKSDNINNVTSFSHSYGCSQMGDDQENTRIALANLIRHPNAGAVLVLGLGCENSNISVLKNYLGEYDANRIRFLECQEVDDEIEEGTKIVRELAAIMAGDRRTKQPVSKLVVGLKCGGSDGLSGITANPVVGAFSDRLIANGGSTILTEVPEMFGAETILMDRACDEEVFNKTVDLINDFKDYYRRHGQTIYENPSPGNKAGGISTLEDKALGCTQKSGSAMVCDVLKYGERIKKAGLNLLSAPGNDLVASTALAISDAQLVLFTTGRGTPFACPVPTVKISTNNALYEKKRNWIDFNCGTLISDENVTIESLSSQLYDYVLAVAGNEPVKSELMGYCDLAIFKQGVTL